MPPPIPPQTRQYQVWAAPIAPVVAATVFLDWFVPFEGPPAYQVEPGLSAAWTQYHTGFLTPPVPSMASWYEALAEPVRAKPSAVREQAFTIDAKWDAPPQQVTFIAGALSEPVRIKPTLPTQFLAYRDGNPQFLLPPWPSLSEPVRIEPGLSAAWTQYHTGFLTPAVPTNVFLPLAEPVRVKRTAVREQAFTMDWKWSAPAVVTAYNWFSPLSEPPPIEQGLGAAHQQVSTVGTAVAFIEYVYPPFSEPVRVKPSLHRVQYLALNPTTPVSVTDLRNFWYQPWSEPVRSKKAVAWQQPFTVSANFSPFVFADSWWRPLSEPVRGKPDIRWREPFTTDWQWNAPVVVISYGWFSQLSEPVRSKKSVPWQQPYVFDWKFAPPAFMSWHQAWREPVWPKRGLHAARQQFFVTDWQWRAPVQVAWYQWLREPVRQKPGLHASRQPVFQMDWKWQAPPITAISYTLGAIEQGDSGRLFYAAMDIVIGAYVTITEEEVGNMAIVTITARSE